MSSDQVITVILAVIAAVGASLVTGILARPKTIAEARATDASGQVALSGDSRAWAQQAIDRADRAEARADKADERCDVIERKMALLVQYTRVLQDEITQITGKPGPPPPAELVPPL